MTRPPKNSFVKVLIPTMSDLSIFAGPNAGFVLELYERFQQDPDSVDEAARALFAHWNPEAAFAAPVQAASAENGTARRAAAMTAPTGMDIRKIVAAARLTRMVRELGHMAAHVDPLGSTPRGDPELGLAAHGLETGDLAVLPAAVVSGPQAEGARNALEALGRLRRVYSGPVGYETDHIQEPEERDWIYAAIESRRFFEDFDAERKCELLERLTEVETFERYLHKTFLGKKRFSIEGSDMLVPMLDEIIRLAAVASTREVVLGMAHRGRLNVMAHVLGKPYKSLLQEFQDSQDDEEGSLAGRSTLGWTGDVKYHLGARRAYKESDIAEMPITLVPNPSHLEFVNPVVEGHARAVQDQRAQPGAPRQDEKASLAILIHGEAAFPGQGIVAETLNLWNLPGYRTGGTIHIIVNNQIGFTTLPSDARSTLYAGDLAKGFEIPIVHVNADDVEACIAVARMAHAYRERFHKDFLIDLVGYRRFGHNESDEPAYTQPRMYEKIRTHPTAREQWANRLEEQSIVTRDEAATMVAEVEERLKTAREKALQGTRPEEAEDTERARARPIETGIPADRLSEMNEALLLRPTGFTPNAKLENILTRRRAALTTPNGIDWGHAEALAFASILADGTPIRLSGQDTERGTFGHRNAVLHDPTTGERHCPLQHLPQARASFAIYNSPLSENAVLGFEYGYSIHAPGVLVLWEAQFGDFVNSAQVIVDQFIVSGNAKWRQIPSLVLLLPHGYEGAGPEHSSARLERFLQLAANNQMRIVNCTTAAQYFHVLRRQAALLESAPRPLIVMSPKSLLRHPRAGSSLSDLAVGTFQTVLDDTEARRRADEITRLILCSGKVYIDLIAAPEFAEARRVAAARVEQLYPFPSEELSAVIGAYPNLREIVWLQEEPSNMGAWTFVAPRLRDHIGWTGPIKYAGRAEAASTAEGSERRHKIEQARLLAASLEDVPGLPIQTKTIVRAG